MGHLAGITSGYGSPYAFSQQQQPWGLSPLGLQGMNINPFATQSYAQPLQQYAQPLQQIVQLLQIVPQQLLHLQQLEYLQQQQIQQVQQLLQVIPAQISQLQQFVSQVVAQAQQTPASYGQLAGTSFTPWPTAPQLFGAQPGQVM